MAIKLAILVLATFTIALVSSEKDATGSTGAQDNTLLSYSSVDGLVPLLKKSKSKRNSGLPVASDAAEALNFIVTSSPFNEIIKIFQKEDTETEEEEPEEEKQEPEEEKQEPEEEKQEPEEEKQGPKEEKQEIKEEKHENKKEKHKEKHKRKKEKHKEKHKLQKENHMEKKKQKYEKEKDK